MSRNKGYRGDNESDNGLPEIGRDQGVSQKPEQKVFYTKGSQEHILMQRMAPGGPQHMQDPSFSGGTIPHHGHPGNQHNDFNAPGHFAAHDQVAPGYNHAPHVQVIIRDANTPITRYITPSMVSIIVKRVLSVAVLIFNEILNWLKYFDWIGTIDLPAMFGYIGKKSKTDVIVCSSDAPFLPTIYGVLCGVATVYALFQIINTIGETVLEYHARKSGAKYEDTRSSQAWLPQNSAQAGPMSQGRSRPQPETDDENPERRREDEQKTKEKRGVSVFRGFQLLHGWVETAAAMVVEDLPQIIVIAASSYFCTVNVEDAVILLIWMIVKEIKNAFRKAFCKQKYKPCVLDCCNDCCKDCCTWTCPLLCCCLVCVFRLCPGAEEQCCEIRPIKICPDCACDCACDCCSGPSICDGLCKACGPKDEDPEWATDLLHKLEALFSVGFVAIVVFQILGITGTFHASL